MAKKNNRKNFGWTSKKSWNRTDKTHGEKNESQAYSFKIPAKKRPSKLWCSPGGIQSTLKRKGKEGRPYGYKPIYDADATKNYQSEAGRLEKASSLSPELKIGKLIFYRASDDCYWHIVIPPDFGHDDLVEDFCQLPPDFFLLAPNEFWVNYPRPNTANPGQPLFPECPEKGKNEDNDDDPWVPDPPPRRPPKLGCTNIAAINFDPTAQVDDGSCQFNEDEDDDDPFVDGGCRKAGCTDPEATNYDPEACYEDGSCEYPRDDPDEPDPPDDPEPDCNNPTPSRCQNGPPPGDCRWASGGTLTGDDAINVCGNGSIPPGFTQDNGYVEFDDGTRKTLCCSPSDGSGGTRTDMFWLSSDGDWSRSDATDKSPVGGTARNENGDIGVFSGRDNGLKVCKTDDGWKAYDNDGPIASGTGSVRLRGGCGSPRGDSFCDIPDCSPLRWRRVPGNDCGPGSCEQSQDGAFGTREECEAVRQSGGGWRTIGSTTTNSSNPTWNLNDFRNGSRTPCCSSGTGRWRLIEVGAGIVYASGTFTNNGGIPVNDFTSGYSYDGYMELQVECD